MSIFDDLLDIKAFRERKAETEVARASGELGLRVREKDEAEVALQAWREESLRRELALYEALCARIVRLRDIEDVQHEVGGFRHLEQERESALRRSEQALDAARTALDGARAVLLDATRMKQKFVQLAQDYAAEIRLEAERKEDLEMEEAASTMRQREELEEWEAQQHE